MSELLYSRRSKRSSPQFWHRMGEGYGRSRSLVKPSRDDGPPGWSKALRAPPSPTRSRGASGGGGDRAVGIDSGRPPPPAGAAWGVGGIENPLAASRTASSISAPSASPRSASAVIAA